jgi:hypothetical protein
MMGDIISERVGEIISEWAGEIISVSRARSLGIRNKRHKPRGRKYRCAG